jgi:hypothetical protein
MKSLVRPLLSTVLAAGLLSACGGGISIDISDDDHDGVFFDDGAFPSGRPASMTVQAASDAGVVGTYSTDDARLTRVFRFSARGGTPETCRFQFEGLREPRTRLGMSGEIQYLPGTDTVHASFLVVDFREYRVAGSPAVTLDRANNAIVFTDAVLATTAGAIREITVSGTIPMRNEAKPVGC